MRQHLISTAILLLCAVVQTSAQALTDRYNKQRPLVIMCSNDCDADITKAVATSLQLPFRLTIKNDEEVEKAFLQGSADLIITNANSCNAPGCIASKSVINYSHRSPDTMVEMRFVGKDRQLIEQLDDQYTRMKQDGEIAAIEKRWRHPELAEPQKGDTAITVTDTLLALSAILFAITLILLWHIRTNRHHTSEISEMMRQTKQMSRYYAIEDNQATHDLIHKYEAILCNPFLGIAFYDKANRLITENDAMKQLGHAYADIHHQPLYNSEGQVVNYIAAIKCKADTK